MMAGIHLYHKNPTWSIQTALVIHALTGVVCSLHICPPLDFPTLSSNLTITAEENTNVTLLFRLMSDKACPTVQMNRTQIMFINRPNASVSANRIFCFVELAVNVCRATGNDRCGCDGSGNAVFTKTVTRHDRGTWLFREMEITFDIHYPPRVKSLSCESPDKIDLFVRDLIVVPKHSPLQVICTWETGHPALHKPEQVQLLDAKGHPLRIVQYGEGEVRAEFCPGVEDTGNITCWVLGARENRTAGLVVTCKPASNRTVCNTPNTTKSSNTTIRDDDNGNSTIPSVEKSNYSNNNNNNKHSDTREANHEHEFKRIVITTIISAVNLISIVVFFVIICVCGWRDSR
ncbi:hypothetical protein V1264_016911 [Littorina saxatilis]|uniref:Uncharacterized protein n=2 Tax=Littorina saxatilis TaxID=31220 RepID=A0AAN9BI13_9CAEN